MSPPTCLGVLSLLGQLIQIACPLRPMFMLMAGLIALSVSSAMQARRITEYPAVLELGQLCYKER